MPMDHYRMSMEAKPLRLLYSKYAGQAPLGSGSVRPLGSVRRRSSPVHDELTICLSQLECEVSKVERVQRYLAMTGGGQGLVDMYGSRKSLHSLAGTSDTSRTQRNNRSSTHNFENKYKIAVSRNPQDPKISNIFSKKVVHLPMLKINLETYVGDTEDSRALESTRKSLRHILDVGRKPTGPPAGIIVSGVKQAGITQYQFRTPAEVQKFPTHQHTPAFARVHFDPVSHRYEEEQGDSLRLESVGEDVRTTSSSGTLCDGDGIEEDQTEQEWEGEGIELQNERDMDNASVMAQRLSSAATLGTSYRYLDFEPYIDADGVEYHEMGSRQRTGIEGMENVDSMGEVPVWPSFDDMKNLRPDLGHTCLAIRPRMSREVRFLDRGSSVIMQKAPPDSFVIRNGVIPKLKYTTHYNTKPNPKRKLEPINPAPHSARDCPMCNLFKVKEPTPCPPNTPRHPGEVLPEIHPPLNQDSLGDAAVEVGEEDGNNIDDTDRSDMEFRKRHKLLNYNINDVSGSPRKIGPINKEVSQDTKADHKFGHIKTNKSR